jgi:hypothetical protein
MHRILAVVIITAVLGISAARADASDAAYSLDGIALGSNV